jgi:pyruvate carboxylase
MSPCWWCGCVRAGADAVDVAIDSMSGTTSQPSMVRWPGTHALTACSVCVFTLLY